MAIFEQRLDEAASGTNRKVLGVVCDTLLSHASGHTSLSPTAQPITPLSILTLSSCTKLLTTLTALRLVQASPPLLSLDSTTLIDEHLPELAAQPIITSAPGAPLTFEQRSKPITLRALLTHASGSGFDILSPQLQAWRRSRGEPCAALSAGLPEAVSAPGLFDPGEGWAYGGGLDWVGLLIERTCGEGLGVVMRKEVWDVLGCDYRAGFCRKELEDEVVEVVTRGEDGDLAPFKYPPTEMKSERGSGGVYCSSANFVRVLADLISPTPKLLTAQTLDLLFSAQFGEGSKPLDSLRQASPVFKGMTGALTGELPATAINHGLGGLLVTEDNPDLGRTKGTMTWGGSCNCLWFVNRDVGIAGWYGSSMFPPGDPTSGELMGAFAREVWQRVREGKGQ
ncbi:beta-lactamase family protein [Paraphaeosphaeria sporulosa]